jgi:hypothetical protein
MNPSQREELQIVNGPVAPSWTTEIMYSVTLSNGYVVTGPSGFEVVDALRRGGVTQQLPPPVRKPEAPEDFIPELSEKGAADLVSLMSGAPRCIPALAAVLARER